MEVRENRMSPCASFALRRFPGALTGHGCAARVGCSEFRVCAGRMGVARRKASKPAGGGLGRLSDIASAQSEQNHHGGDDDEHQDFARTE